MFKNLTRFGVKCRGVRILRYIFARNGKYKIIRRSSQFTINRLWVHNVTERAKYLVAIIYVYIKVKE